MDTHTQNRIATYQRYADQARARAEAAFKTSDQHAARFSGGQPILNGHHSAPSARRAQNRSHTSMDTALKELNKEKYWRNRIASAQARHKQAHDPGVIQRRIQRKQAELADLEERVQGATHPEHRQRLQEWIDQARTVLADSRRELKESNAKVWTRDDFTPGDFVLHDGVLYEIKRVNAKSLTIPSLVGAPARGVYRLSDNPYSWTDTLSYDKVQDRASASKVAGRGL